MAFFKKTISFTVILTMLLSFLTLPPVSAEYDAVTVNVPQDYTAAYCASTGESSLAKAADGNTVFQNGDWAEYTVTIPKEGKYSVSLYEVNNGVHTPVYSVLINGEEKLSNKEGTSSGSYVSFTLGEISFTKSGSYTVKLSKSSGYWAYLKTMTFTYTGEIDTTVTINVPQDYTAAYCASTGESNLAKAADGNTMFQNGDWAEYTVTIPKAGKYSVSLYEVNNGVHTPVYSVSVNGKEKLSNKEGTSSGSYVSFTLGEISFTKSGSYTVKLSKSDGYWAYLQTVTLEYVGEAELDIRLPMSGYDTAYNASKNSSTLDNENGNICLRPNDSATFTVEAEESGVYNFGINISSTDNVVSHITVSVNGEEQLKHAAAVLSGNYTALSDKVFGNVYLNKGKNTVKLECMSDSAGAYTKEIFFNQDTSNNVRMHVRSYSAAHSEYADDKATLKAETTGPNNTIWFVSDWAEYFIYVPKAGVYDVGLSLTANVVNGVGEALTYSFAADNEEKLSNVSKNVLNTEAYGEKADVSFGHLVFYKAGMHTLKISKTNGGFSYSDGIFLNFVKDVPVSEVKATEKTTVSAEFYSRGFDASKNSSAMSTENELISFETKDWTEYVLKTEKMGLYRVSVDTTGGTYDVLVNDKTAYRQGFENNNGASFKTCDSFVILKNGMNTLKFSNTGKYDMYLKSFTVSYIGTTINAGKTEESVKAFAADGLLGEKTADERIAFSINAKESGIYKIAVETENSAGASFNIYDGEDFCTVTKTNASNEAEKSYAVLRLKAGEHIIKLKILNENVNISDIKISFVSEKVKEEYGAFLAGAENAENEAELYELLKENSELIGADIDALTENIQHKSYVFTRLLKKSYAAETDFLKALYNTIALETAKPTLLTQTEGGKLTASVRTDVFEDDGTLVVAAYDGEKLKSVKTEDFLLGEVKTTEGQEIGENSTVKVFALSDFNNLKPVKSKGAVQANIYVSDKANGEKDGSKEHPYATIAEAKAKVAELTKSMTGDIVVNILPGYYELSETEVFTKEHGGSGDCRVIYKGTDPNDLPVISGGKKVSGWQNEGNGIYSADFSGGYVRNLYVNGYPAQRARSNTRYKIKSYSGTTMKAKLGSALNFSKPSDLVLVWTNEWATHYTPVKSLVQQDETTVFEMEEEFAWLTGVDFIEIGSYSYEPCTDRFYIENALELLDEAGEFYYDEANEKIYYMPYEEEELLNVYASQLDEMISVSGTSEEDKALNISFENLSFKYGTWNNNTLKQYQSDEYIKNQTQTGGVISQEYGLIPAQFSINYADNVTVCGCEFSCLGTTAIAMREAVTNAAVTGNLFRDIGGGALSVGSFFHDCEHGEGNALSNIEMADNVIRRTSLTYFGMPAISIYYEKNVNVLRNDIADVPYTGISAGWGWGTANSRSGAFNISNNKIGNVMATLLDGGHIYTLGDLGGTVISENYMYKTGDGRGGVYNDSGSANIEITNNVIDVYMTKNSYWWVQGMYGIHDMCAKGNYAHSSGGIYENSGENITALNNTSVLSDGTWDGAGDETAQAIINNAGVSAKYKYLLNKAELPNWRKNPLLVP